MTIEKTLAGNTSPEADAVRRELQAIVLEGDLSQARRDLDKTIKAKAEIEDRFTTDRELIQADADRRIGAARVALDLAEKQVSEIEERIADIEQKITVLKG